MINKTYSRNSLKTIAVMFLVAFQEGFYMCHRIKMIFKVRTHAFNSGTLQVLNCSRVFLNFCLNRFFYHRTLYSQTLQIEPSICKIVFLKPVSFHCEVRCKRLVGKETFFLILTISRTTIRR